MESSGGGSVVPSRRSPGPAPHVGRREALTASGLGIASLMLPAASAAASSLAFVPTAYTYAADDRTVAAWLPFDSGDPANYSANGGAGVLASRIDRDRLTAYLTQSGSPTSNGSASIGDPELSGLTPPSAGTNGLWRMRNSAVTVDPATAPHLRFSIGVTAGTLSLATLVLHAVQNLPGTSAGSLGLAVYVTAPDLDGTPRTTLRRTATVPASDTFHHVVINLGLSGRTFTSGTITVGVHPYATPEARDVRLWRYDSNPTPAPLTPQDTVDADRVLGTLDGSSTGSVTNWMAAFIGTYVAPAPA